MRLHPLTKMYTACLSIGLVLIPTGRAIPIVPYLLWIVIVSLSGYRVGLSPLRISRMLRGWLILSAVLVISQSLLYRADDLHVVVKVFQFTVAGKNIGNVSYEGILSGLSASLRILVVMVSSLILFGTTTVEDLYYSLMKVGVPRSMSFGIATGMRFVPVVERGYSDITNAMRLQGVDIERMSVWRRYLVLMPRTVVPLVMSIFRMGLQLQIALITRGFFLRRTPTPLRTIRIGASDVLYAASISVVLSGILIQLVI